MPICPRHETLNGGNILLDIVSSVIGYLIGEREKGDQQIKGSGKNHKVNVPEFGCNGGCNEYGQQQGDAGEV